MAQEGTLFSKITIIAHCWTLRLYHLRGQKKYWLLSLPDDKFCLLSLPDEKYRLLYLLDNKYWLLLLPVDEY
jgi:hypothetical protein